MVGDQAGGERPFSATENRRNKEVRGELHSRAEKRVGKELVGAGIEELQTPVDGSDLQENGPGPAPGLQFQGQENRDWASPIGRMAGQAASGPNMGLSWLKKDGGLNKMDGLLGRKLKNKPKGPIAPLEKAGFLGRFSSRKGPNSEDPLISWVIEEPRREQGDVGLSMTDRALEEEVKRYALNPYPKGKRAVGTPLLLFSNSDRAPEGESFDHPGEDSKNRDKAKDKEGNNGGSVSQDTENEKEDPWEECSLAKFSQFLGFSTEGLEKEILSFLIKIRKRREKIHSKELLEKSKFERELKRLECSVNYEGGNSRKLKEENYQKLYKEPEGGPNVYSGNQDSGDVGGYCEKFGIGEILDWRARNAEGAAGGILICWDKRVLEFWIGRRVSFPCLVDSRSQKMGLSGFLRVCMVLLPKWKGRNLVARIEVRGSASYRLAVKMKEIKKKLKVWNKEVFGRLETNKASALYQLDFWDRVESERILSMEEAELKKEAKDSFKKWVLLEEAHWRQHSREIWLKDGDRNTGFFHRMASAHRRNNAMDRIKVNGEWLVEEQEVREGVVNSFQQLLSEDMGWQADIGSIQMNGDKSPGPDGFTVAFWQNAWDFAKEEIMEMFKEFHEHNSFVKSLNNTFLVLIPKKSGAENLGDFRPISLVGGLYKLLAKVLANRLKKVIGKVVSYAQNAFVMRRQILDASLIANEVIDSWQKKKEKGLVCKLDIEKAYDSINWNFLMKVLKKMGFGTKWMRWMWSCVSSAKFSILVNGVPAGFFPSTRGLRQGDPLSPYLFVMGMEVLDVLIRRAVEGGYLSGCNIRGGSRTSLNISHLFFADDTIVFCEASKEQVSHLSWILFWFEAASGLRINLAKSEIIPIGEVEDSLELAAELGCRVGSLPSHYLGLPLGVPNRATSMWDGVEERIRRRLALWKRQYISKGGRITLIKSTLASLPTYQMSIFRMPKSVAKRVEKTQRDFLWGGGNLEGKVHLVKWDAVCTEKHKGGLGLRRIATLNRALLGKWIWRGLWLEAKEGPWAAGVGVWKEIMKEDDWCWDNLAFRVGKGSKIKFWKDCWCTDTPLSQCFNQLFALAVHRDATIEEMWDHDAGQGDWKLVFVRDFNDWEMDMVGELLHTLRGQGPLWRMTQLCGGREEMVFSKSKKPTGC
ncbi:LINE-1 reverse transcriptase-like [Vitis vinifera]|uniref:LINE-1 reverse transcriptase-like n=1 Tax=Vitis vinifera TaxID=29760 RepID=A0A438CJE3_VITVI|nr:LINE-1 reverse transcriptase-like [Vitis vinifera]